MRRWDPLLKSDLTRCRAVARVLITTGLAVLGLVLFVACASTPPDDPDELAAAHRLSQQEEPEPEVEEEPDDDVVEPADLSPFRELPPAPAAESVPPDTPEIETLETTPPRIPEIATPELILPSTDALADASPSQASEDTPEPSDEPSDEPSGAATQERPQERPQDTSSDMPPGTAQGTDQDGMTMLEQPAPPAPPAQVVPSQTTPAPPVASPDVEQPPSGPPADTEQPPELAPAPAPEIAPTPAPARELAASLGEEVSVELPGLGWIYLGSEDPGAPELRRRTHHAESTEFVFRTRGEGTHRLRFQRQDLSLGAQETQELLLNTLPTDASARLSQEAQSELPEDAPAERGTTDISESDLPQQSGIDMTPETLHQALEQSLLEERDTDAERFLQQLLDAGYVPEAGLLREAAERRAARGEIGGAIDLLEQHLIEYPSRNGRDRVHYLLGSLYEADSERRDLRKSRSHYEVVVTEYPRSRYLDDSQRRINYQNRHFFEIR